jgi:hypothetical protein
MNDKSEKQGSYEDAETAFLMILNAQKAFYGTLNKQQNNSHVSIRQMMRLVTGPQTNGDQALLNQISLNFNTRRQFRAILNTHALATHQKQAAAASTSSHASQHRPSDEFDLYLRASSKDDGLFYLQLAIGETAETDKLSAAEVLFAETNGSFLSIPLPNIIEGLAQIVLPKGHPMIDAFRDPEAEFFIR